MNNDPFSFEYGEEEKEEKRPEAAVKKHVAKAKKKVDKAEKPVEQPLPETPTPVTIPTDVTSVIASEPQLLPAQTTVIVAETKKQTETHVEKEMNPVVVGAVAVAATAAAVAAVGPTALAKLKSLRSKGKTNKSNKSDNKTEERRQQEEKKKEEQTKCDKKSFEVKAHIEESNALLESAEIKVNEFYKKKDLPLLQKETVELKEQVKKLKKSIKELDK